MVLKEAFHYQSVLTLWIRQACMAFRDPSVTTLTRQYHQKSKVNPDADDEVVVSERAMAGRAYLTVDKLIQFAQVLIDTKNTLGLKIEEAKRGMDKSIDLLITENKNRDFLITSLSDMLKASAPKTEKISGTDYKFNAEGNQVSYRYQIVVENEDGFIRQDVMNEFMKLKSEFDDTSIAIDKLLVNTEVDFEMPFESILSFHEAYSDWVTKMSM